MTDYIDSYIGKKLKKRRRMLGINQNSLATKVGVSYQQIQKYEKGTNRIGSSKLYQFARVLGVPVNYFFEGIETPPDNNEQNTQNSTNKDNTANSEDEINFVLTGQTAMEIILAFNKITNPMVQKKVLELVKEIADSPLYN